MQCELATTCLLFNEGLSVTPASREMYRARYCRGQYSECARYLVYIALGRAAVPIDLYPNDRLRALRMVRTHEHDVARTLASDCGSST